MILERMKPGQTLYRVDEKTRNKRQVWPVTVHEIDLENRRVFASWNHNPPRWYQENNATRWRIKNPNQAQGVSQ